MNARRMILRTPEIRARAAAMIAGLPADAEKPLEVLVRPYEERRTVEQNDRMWAMLADIARQVDWYGKRLTPEDWKTVFTASLKKCQAVPGIDGGFVVLGLSTSRMSKKELSDLITLASAFGDERGVRWSGPREARYDPSEKPRRTGYRMDEASAERA